MTANLAQISDGDRAEIHGKLLRLRDLRVPAEVLQPIWDWLYPLPPTGPGVYFDGLPERLQPQGITPPDKINRTVA
jgi:hypothetical protein